MSLMKAIYNYTYDGEFISDFIQGPGPKQIYIFKSGILSFKRKGFCSQAIYARSKGVSISVSPKI